LKEKFILPDPLLLSPFLYPVRREGGEGEAKEGKG
jgi:hypothetical protein